MKRFLAIFAALALFSFSAQAQDGLPAVPEPIQNLVNEGAQIRYLGKDHGLDAWLTMKSGQEQYFYVLPDGSAFLMGVLFNKKGKAVTVDQVRRLQTQGGDVLDSLASDPDLGMRQKSGASMDPFSLKSPSERLFYDIENSNWIPVGAPEAPALYSFIDPQCPHCHAFMSDAKAFIESGALQVRMIPVGLRDETRAQAAFLLASPSPQERWFRHMEGDETALPAKAEINQQGVQRNLAIMQSWDLDITPLIIYRAKDGSVKIVQGRPKDLESLIRDIKA